MARKFAPLLASMLLAAVCASCAHQNPYYDSSKPHHTHSGFRNNYVSEFFTGYRQTQLRPDEILQEIVLPHA